MYDGITGECTLLKSASECISGDEEGLQQKESVLLQFRRAKESTSTGFAQFEVKLHKDANPVLIFGELMRAAKSRKVELSEEMQEILDLHNVFRCMRDVPLCEWDTSIVTTAQSWADIGVYEHSSNDFRKQRSEICGENLSWHCPTRTGLDSTQVWVRQD